MAGKETVNGSDDSAQIRTAEELIVEQQVELAPEHTSALVGLANLVALNQLNPALLEERGIVITEAHHEQARAIRERVSQSAMNTSVRFTPTAY
jgi:hypothetical protein